jgi:hypothetical protein
LSFLLCLCHFFNKINDKGRTGPAWNGVGRGRQGGEMTQTMYACVNKWKKKKKKKERKKMLLSIFTSKQYNCPDIQVCVCIYLNIFAFIGYFTESLKKKKKRCL